MALAPARHPVGDTITLAVQFTDADYADIDPTTVTFKLFSPDGTVKATYVYGTDAELEKDSTGDYHVEVTPDEPGRWTYHWITTGTHRATKVQGRFVVQDTPDYNGTSGYV